MAEVFRDIPNYEGIYQASNLGNILSLKRNLIMRKGLGSRGYHQVSLYSGGNPQTRAVHQLVAEAFLNHKPDGTQKLVVNHINFDKLDNSLENLELVTNRENSNQKHLQSTSKYVGVHWHNANNSWVSSISVNGKDIVLGSYDNEEEASNHYKEALHCLLNNKKIRLKRKVAYSKTKGVTWDKNRSKWVAQYYNKGKINYIGRYKTEQEAIESVLKYKQKNNYGKSR